MYPKLFNAFTTHTNPSKENAMKNLKYSLPRTYMVAFDFDELKKYDIVQVHVKTLTCVRNQGDEY